MTEKLLLKNESLNGNDNILQLLLRSYQHKHRKIKLEEPFEYLKNLKTYLRNGDGGGSWAI